MKNLFIVVLMLFAFASCQKEKFCKNKNCGTVVDDAITFDANGAACYSLSIKNKCSNNVKTWCFDYNTWFNTPVGQEFCVDNVESW